MKVDPAAAHDALLAAGVPIVGVSTAPSWQSPHFRIDYDATATDDHRLQAASIMASLASPAAELAGAQQAAIDAVDARTSELIQAGFVYRGERFSLSLGAQSNWQMLWLGRNTFVSYPHEISTADGRSFALTNSMELEDFCQTAFATVFGHLANGRAYRSHIRAASTATEVEAIVDRR